MGENIVCDAIRKALQKFQNCTEANFEEVKRSVDMEIELDLKHCGSQRWSIENEISKVVKEVNKRLGINPTQNELQATRKLIYRKWKSQVDARVLNTHKVLR